MQIFVNNNNKNSHENVYQAKNILKYNDTDKKIQILIPSNQVLTSSVDKLKRIIIDNLKNDKVINKKYEKFQKRDILQDSVNIFQVK